MSIENEKYLLSSVKNALQILRSYSLKEPEKGIRELSETLGISKSSVQRLMATLASEGFLTKDPITRRYRLGVSVLSLATIVNEHLEIHKEAPPFLKRLVDRVKETAHIGVIQNDRMVYVQKIEAEQAIRIFTYIGKENPIHCTGSGKVQLAFKEEEDIERVIRLGLEKFSEKTITDPDEFRLALEKIRSDGYAISQGELTEGIVSIAAPIRDYSTKVIAAVNVVGPAQRINDSNIDRYVNEVVKTGLDISESLGYWNK